jgi:DNA-binding beta-propeller fold protein YncE
LAKVNLDGALAGAWGTRGSGKGDFDNPYQVVTDGQGHYFVVDRDNNRIQVLDSLGHFIREIRIGAAPTAETIDPQKKWIFVSSLDGRFVKVFNLEGKFIGNMVESGQKGQGISDITAMTVLGNGDIAALGGGSRVFIFRPMPPPAQR